MFKFYLNSNFRLAGTPEFPAQFVQYSTEDVEVYCPFQNIGITIIMNIVRPDGFKTNQIFMEYLREDEENAGTYVYGAKITPYHTALIPGTQSVGTMIMSFMLKEFEDDILVNVLSSPITKIPVDRSIEPNAEFLPSSVEENFASRITALETVSFDHSLLTPQSRGLPNQHPIGAITDLAPKVTVHIGEYDPTVEADTWFDVKGIDEEVNIDGNWEVVSSTPLITNNFTFQVPPIEPTQAVRLVVIGNNYGEIYRQEFYAQTNNEIISGQALIYQDAFSSVIVNFTLEAVVDGTPGAFPRGNPILGYQTVQFFNVGTNNISSFNAAALEVFL